MSKHLKISRSLNGYVQRQPWSMKLHLFTPLSLLLIFKVTSFALQQQLAARPICYPCLDCWVPSISAFVSQKYSWSLFIYQCCCLTFWHWPPRATTNAQVPVPLSLVSLHPSSKTVTTTMAMVPGYFPLIFFESPKQHKCQHTFHGIKAQEQYILFITMVSAILCITTTCSALSGHHQVIHLYINLFTLLSPT